MYAGTSVLLLVIALFSSVSCQIVSRNSNCSLVGAFQCANGNGCIQRRYFCDGVDDCSDGSDEIRYNTLVHSPESGMQCSQRRGRSGMSGPSSPRMRRNCFLPKEYMCDHEIDCFFGFDESNCSHTFQCANVSANLRRFFPVQYQIRINFCDNIRHCSDGSDERSYNSSLSNEGYQCAVTKTRITNHCLLPNVYVCDGISDCDDGIDECRCSNDTTSAYINDRCFRCFDETLIVPQKQMCDGRFNCPDLTDECLCPLASRPKLCQQVRQVGQLGQDSCEVGQIICRPWNTTTSVVVCVNRNSVCDQRYDCPLGEDEENCNIDFTQIFNCSDGRSYIPLYQYCDNFTDCVDGSDEQNCSRLYECKEFGYSKNPQRRAQKAYSFSDPRFAVPCDKIPDCQDLDDECNSTLCPGALPGYCSYVQGLTGFVCPNSGSAIIGKEVCDGFPTCNDTAPAESADEFNCSATRFYCNDRGAKSLPIHIPLSARCNGITDCYDFSDEMNCSNNYYCESGMPLYIPRSKVCNNVQDCSDGKDECQNCATSPFSSDSFLIQSYALQVFVWIIGLVAVAGNIGVIIHSTVQLHQQHDKLNKIACNHRILVINLAIADLLLGIYLIGLGSVNSLYKGIYCQVDIQWRASNSCVALGTIAVISTECSIFLLATMATHRLIMVIKPFKGCVRRRYVCLSILVAWTIAIILATVPLSESQTEYFLSTVWYRSNPFLTEVNRYEAENFTTNLLTFENPNNPIFSQNKSIANTQGFLTWTHMIPTISRLKSTYIPENFYGYYSAHGVCLPRFFPDPSAERSWGFSLSLIFLNFFLFMWMFGAYAAIYRLSVKRSAQAGRCNDDGTSNLQHKITRIVITNFCCWIPICIMAFISVGGEDISPDAYAASAIILLPINTAFNPFLYSDLPDLIWKHMMPIRKRFAKTKCGQWCISTMHTSSTRRSSRSSQSSRSRYQMRYTTKTNVVEDADERNSGISYSSSTHQQNLTIKP